jgi:hypothetical protein
LPDAVYEDMALDAEREGFVNRAVALLPNPLVAQHGAWVAEFLTAAQAELMEEEEEPSAAPTVEVHAGTPPAAEEDADL